MDDETPAKALPIWQRGRVCGSALVDATDHERLARYRWLRDATGYVYRNHTSTGRHEHLFLHRQVSQAPPRLLVTFHDGDPLNCRRANLCVHPGAQVRRDKRQKRNPYTVRVSIDNQQYCVGRWPTRSRAEEAKVIVARVALDLRGRRLNRAQIQRALDVATGYAARRYATEAAAAELLRDAATLVPAGLPADVREEAVQSIAVDLLAGVITPAEVDGRTVRRYVRAAWGLRDAWRFRSLDAPVRSDDGRTLGELLAA